MFLAKIPKFNSLQTDFWFDKLVVFSSVANLCFLIFFQKAGIFFSFFCVHREKITDNSLVLLEKERKKEREIVFFRGKCFLRLVFFSGHLLITDYFRCFNASESYACSCPPGFEGDMCEIDIDECAINNLCQNNATCHDAIANFTCECQPGWDGWL